MDIVMSSITTPLHSGDAELARLLASGSSFGWRVQEPISDIARRCEWPPWLTGWIADLSRGELSHLVDGSAVVWRIFAEPVGSAAFLDHLLGRPVLEVITHGDRPRLSIPSNESSRKLLRTAALGLLDVLERAGTDSLGICAAAPCDRPVLRVGRRSRSRSCSPRCANRERVDRYRAQHVVASTTQR